MPEKINNFFPSSDEFEQVSHSHMKTKTTFLKKCSINPYFRIDNEVMWETRLFAYPIYWHWVITMFEAFSLWANKFGSIFKPG